MYRMPPSHPLSPPRVLVKYARFAPSPSVRAILAETPPRKNPEKAQKNSPFMRAEGGRASVPPRRRRLRGQGGSDPIGHQQPHCERRDGMQQHLAPRGAGIGTVVLLSALIGLGAADHVHAQAGFDTYGFKVLGDAIQALQQSVNTLQAKVD